MCPFCEIILFGDDYGVKEISEELGLKHIPEIKKNEFGKPLLDSLFESAKKYAKNNILCYISCDIVLLSDLTSALKNIKFPVYLLAGRRWDLKIENAINFDESDWQEKWLKKAKEQGRLHGHCATDYLLFPKNFEHKMPPFAIGVPGWDNWLVYRAKSMEIPVIDATLAVSIIHQEHDYNYSSFGKVRPKLGGRIEGPQLEKNIRLAGNSLDIMTLIDADWILNEPGILKKPPFLRHIMSRISLFYPWRKLRKLRRQLRHFFSI